MASIIHIGKAVRNLLHLDQSGLEQEEAKLPAKVRRVLPSLLDGGFVTGAENVIAMGLPGRGKSHFMAALGRELILRHQYAVLFTPTFKLVQHSQWAVNRKFKNAM